MGRMSCHDECETKMSLADCFVDNECILMICKTVVRMKQSARWLLCLSVPGSHQIWVIELFKLSITNVAFIFYTTQKLSRPGQGHCSDRSPAWDQARVSGPTSDIYENIFSRIPLDNNCSFFYTFSYLTRPPLDKMAAILQAILSDVISWMESFIFWLKCHWNLSLEIQLTSQHWFR